MDLYSFSAPWFPLIAVFSFLIADNLGLCTIAFIGTDQKVFIIPHNPITPVTSGDFYLIAPLYVVILQQFYSLSISQRILQINKKSVQQVQVFYLQVFNLKTVKFIHQVLFEFMKRLSASLLNNLSGNTPAAERVSFCFYTASAFLSSLTFLTTVQTADCLHSYTSSYHYKPFFESNVTSYSFHIFSVCFLKFLYTPSLLSQYYPMSRNLKQHHHPQQYP